MVEVRIKGYGPITRWTQSSRPYHCKYQIFTKMLPIRRIKLALFVEVN